MTNKPEGFDGSTTTYHSPQPAFADNNDVNYIIQNNYKSIHHENKNSNNSFTNPKYFETFQTFIKLFDVIKKIHYTKITNEETNNEQVENGIFILAQFIDAFNRDYSGILGVKITLNIRSHRWNKLYEDRNQQSLPTFVGFEQ